VKVLLFDHLGRIGTIYCDLFQRESASMRKYENPAHFTITCSRRLDDDEFPNFDKMTNAQSERIVVDGNSKTKRFQLPIVVLVTNFPRSHNEEPVLLNISDIDTLFHEMGHAMHCIFLIF
jgi:intermediate peptidase